jgi:hypothetical protein
MRLAALALALALAACSRSATEGDPGVAADEAGVSESESQAAQQLAALGGPADDATAALYSGEFQAYGALDALGAGEGAWEMTLFDGYAQFARPGLGEDGGPTQAREVRQGGMQVTAGPLVITLRAQDCPLPNGESLPYVATVMFESVVYQGCARRGAGGGERPNWASYLPELIPAIDACLARAGARTARVTTASALADGEVAVRVRARDGERNACVAAADGARVEAFEPILDTDRLGGEGDPEFVRAFGEDPAPPPANRCGAGAEARDAAGVLLGWLLRQSC